MEESSNSCESLEMPAVLPSLTYMTRAKVKIRLRIAYWVAIIVICAYFVGFLIYPWYKMRETWKQKSLFFISKNVQQKSQELQSFNEIYLSKLQKTASLLLRTVILSNLLQTEKQKVTAFINFNRYLHKSIKPRPYATSIIIYPSTFYRIKWDEDLYSFNFSTVLPINETHSELKKYSSYKGLRSMDFKNHGKSVGIVNTIDFINKQLKDCEDLYVDEEDPNVKLFSLSLHESSQNRTISTRFEIKLDDFGYRFSNHSLFMDTEYAFFNNQNKTVMTSKEFNPLSIETQRESDSVIDKVNDLNNEINMYKSVIDNSVNIISSVPLRQTNTIFHHLFTVCNYTRMINNSLWETSKIYFYYLFIAFIIHSFGLYLMISARLRRTKKIDSINNSMESYLVTEAGYLFKVIQKIRNIELNNPDEQVVNKMMDDVVQKIAVHNVHPYKCKNNCPFCTVATDSVEYSFTESTENVYSMWKGLIGEKIATYKNLGDLKFRWRVHQSHPVKYLVQLFATIIVKEDLLIPQIDPNMLIEMVKDYAEKYCKDPSIAAMQLNALYIILHTQLRYWVMGKVDRLLCYIAALFFLVDIDKLSADLTQMEPQNDQNDVRSNLQTSQEIFDHPLGLSYLYNVEILNFVSIYIPSLQNDSEFARYSNRLLVSLLSSRFLWTHIEYFGGLRILIESTNFSPMENYKDRETFLLFVLSYANMAPFYSPAKISDEVSMKFLECHGISTVDQILVTKFCMHIVKYMVIPMTNNLNKFVPMENHDKNCKAIIEHWTHKLKLISAIDDDDM